jgi:hypothetical protein
MIQIRSLIFCLILISLNFVQAQENPHGNIEIACELCHSNSDWNVINAHKFNHDQTAFKLRDAHKSIYCVDCHENLVFNIGQKQCFNCHQDIHKAELGVECQKCHSERVWNDMHKFMEMHSQTNFPLVGVHANIDCESCHFNEQQRQFANISTQCSGCHLEDYMATIDPEHQKSRFDLDCQNCHSIVGNDWKAPNFPHADTFLLTGGHGGLQCAACHLNNQYTTLSTDCYFCHESDYTNTTNPSHISVQFPTTCEDCHTIKNWGSANWDHDRLYFPIYSGSHRGEWDRCADCHENISNFTQFECINCHEHSKTRTDNRHREERNYIYNSEACYDCHPRGKGED